MERCVLFDVFAIAYVKFDVKIDSPVSIKRQWGIYFKYIHFFRMTIALLNGNL